LTCLWRDNYAHTCVLFSLQLHPVGFLAQLKDVYDDLMVLKDEYVALMKRINNRRFKILDCTEVI